MLQLHFESLELLKGLAQAAVYAVDVYRCVEALFALHSGISYRMCHDMLYDMRLDSLVVGIRLGYLGC